MSVIGPLVNSTLKMSLLIVLALMLMELLRGRSAALRHWVLAVVVGCAAVMPILDAIRPTASLRLEPSGSIQSTGQRPQSVPQAGRQPTASVPPGRDASTGPAAARDSFASERIGRALRAIWLFGLLASVFLLLAGVGRLTWLAARSRRLTAGRWRDLANEIAGAYGLRRRFVLLQSDHPSLLGTWGFPVPKVILPVAARDWSEDRIRVVLWHELAHIRRGDWMVQMGVELLRAAYWFNPLLWVLSRRLRVESEHACDDEVMSRGVEGQHYATHLVELARGLRPSRTKFPGFPAAAMARPSSLERRVRAMLNDRLNRNRLTGWTRVFIVMPLLVATVAIAAAQNLFSTVSGSVHDSQGALLPGVTLVLSNSQKQTKYEVKSNSAGSFEFVGLQSGDYQLEASVPGFATLRQAVSVNGQNLDRDLVLQVGSLQETVTAVDQAEFDPSTTAVRQIGSPRPVPDCRVSATGGIGGQIRAPIRLRQARPEYPRSLHGTGREGDVVLDGRITLDGFIRDLQVRNEVHPEFAAAAIAAVNQWQWDQTLLNCVPVEVAITVTVRFRPGQ